jgi:S-adenosylmethionine:tRNA ribosyltransferase-isomerase
MANRAEILMDEFDYKLPVDRIAEYPLPRRDSSKLLCYENGQINASTFEHLPQLLSQNSCLILNNTKVIEARILFQKSTGGVIEVFCLEPDEPFININEVLEVQQSIRWKCYIGGASKWKHGEILKKEFDVNGSKAFLDARFIRKNADSFTIEFTWNPPIFHFVDIMHAAGAIPLPPYIKRKPETADSERYQTIFAESKGSVAAPTAALHFTKEVFDGLKTNSIAVEYITLHVGAGTFKPVKTNSIAEHQMHEEHFHVSLNTLIKLTHNKELVAVGTTSLRTLESLYWIGIKILQGFFKSGEELYLGQWEAYELENKKISYKESINAIINFLKQGNNEIAFCRTSLLIVPGYKFYSSKGLITNFHQPSSTLLLLVAAFIGDDWKAVYDYALQNDFRFLSYGDSSLLWRKE